MNDKRNGNGSASSANRPSNDQGKVAQRPAGEGTPRKELWGITDRNEVSYWTRIGVGFENRDGSWALYFDYIPIRSDVKVQLREPRDPQLRERDAEPERRVASR